MKRTLFFTSFFIAIFYAAQSQNVGIGITNPIRAKLEVNGVAGSGNTVALFGGDGAGISLQRNWPTIGFNQYRDLGTGSGKYIANGYAAIQHMDPGTGTMAFDIYSPGSANAEMPVPRRVFTLGPKGNVTVGTAFGNAGLTISRIPGSESALQIAGVQYPSYFNAGSQEWTFIRAGADGGSVVINDIPNGKINLGLFGGTTRVGINVSDPVTSLQTMGGTSFFRRSITISRANPVINVGDNTYLSVYYSFSSGPQMQGFLTNGLVPGQVLIIESDGANPEYGFDLKTEGNLFLQNGGMRMRPWQTITLIWNGTKWLETSRSENSYF